MKIRVHKILSLKIDLHFRHRNNGDIFFKLYDPLQIYYSPVLKMQPVFHVPIKGCVP